MSNASQSKAPCNTCLQVNNHHILHVVREVTEDPSDRTWSSEQWELLKCCGCDTICARKIFSFSEWDEVEIACYPPRVSRRLPGWIRVLDDDSRTLLEEIYSALHANSHRLAVMGSRTLLERVLTEKVGDNGSFEQKLERLRSQGFVGEPMVSVLTAALHAGHAAAHRGHRATSEELNDVMDIIEHLLQAVYAAPIAAERLRRRTPSRPPRQ